MNSIQLLILLLTLSTLPSTFASRSSRMHRALQKVTSTTYDFTTQQKELGLSDLESLLNNMTDPDPSEKNSSDPYSQYSGFDYYNTNGCCDCKAYYDFFPSQAKPPENLAYSQSYYKALKNFYETLIVQGQSSDDKADILAALKNYYGSIEDFLLGYSDLNQFYMGNPWRVQEILLALHDAVNASACRNDFLEDLAVMCSNYRIGKQYFEDFGKAFEDMKAFLPETFTNFYIECYDMYLTNLPETYCDPASSEKIQAASDSWKINKAALTGDYNYTDDNNYSGDHNYTRDYDSPSNENTNGKTQPSDYNPKTWSIYTIPRDIVYTFLFIGHDSSYIPKYEDFEAVASKYSALTDETSDESKKQYYSYIASTASSTYTALKELYDAELQSQEYYFENTCCECLSDIIIYGIYPSNYYTDFQNLNYLEDNLFLMKTSSLYGSFSWVLTEVESNAVIFTDNFFDIWIPAMTMEPNKSYEITISALSYYTGNYSSLVVRIKTGIPPSGGSVSVNTNSVRAMLDQLEISTSGWTGQTELTISYIFYYRAQDYNSNDPRFNYPSYLAIDQDETTTSLSARLPNNFWDDEQSPSWEYLVGVRVTDKHGLSATAVTPVTVTRYNPSAEELQTYAGSMFSKGLSFQDSFMLTSMFNWNDEASLRQNDNILNEIFGSKSNFFRLFRLGICIWRQQ